ncbi:MAG: BREX system Lon protease-like protein BrxL [Planctomycetota bacterium]
MELDALDKLSARAFDGFIVRKDLVRQFKGQYPVPTYVCEFLLGRYCASIDPTEIAEGLQIVSRQLSARAVRAGEEELFKSRSREQGSVKIIDLVKGRLDAKTDSYLAELPSLTLKDARISSELVHEHERMLTGGFYAEVTLVYDAAIAQEKGGRPFGVEAIRPIQLSKREVLDSLGRGRELFTTAEWKKFLIRSIGLEPEALSERTQNIVLLRMVPFVERNYNMVELGPRGTGKSHIFQQISPYSHLVSGGKTSVPRMFVNNATGQRGLVCQYDVVCFDEIAGVSFDQKDGVNIMQGYMESGEFSRGKESIRADGGIVMVGNFDVDVAHQQRIGHLFGPLPPEMRDRTALMDRIHAYLPGWDIPKVSKELFTDHFGLVSDFLAECWNRLRTQSRVSVLQDRVFFGGALSGRDTTGAQKTISGLLKLLYPDAEAPVAEEDLEWAVRLALECRRRVKEQQKRIGSAEFRNTHFSYQMGPDGVEKFVVTPELQSEDSIGTDPLPPGQMWAISPGGMDENPGLYRIDVTAGPGSGMKILNQPTPKPFKESMNYGVQNLYARAKELVGDRDPRAHEFTVQLRAFDASRTGTAVGLPALLALCGSLLEKSMKGGLIAVGGLNLGGTIEQVYNAVGVAELAIDKGATVLLMPVSSRRQLFELPDDMATKIDVQFYSDAREALIKALCE